MRSWMLILLGAACLIYGLVGFIRGSIVAGRRARVELFDTDAKVYSGLGILIGSAFVVYGISELRDH